MHNEYFLPKSKLTDIMPVTNALPTDSKIFEKRIQNEINECADQFLVPFLCGYRKG